MAMLMLAIVIIVVIGMLMALIKSCVDAKHRREEAERRQQFCDDYNLSEEDFPYCFKLRIKEDIAEMGAFRLNFPYWLYSNKDGSKDRRRSGNRLRRPDSSLWIDQYEITTNDPYNMVQLVDRIRRRNPDVRIRHCREEHLKYTRLYSYRNRRVTARSVSDLYRTYRSDPYEFETFVAGLFQEMGYRTRQTARTNDGGYDIDLYRDGKRTIVECKCYEPGSKISRPLLQKLVGANQAIHADHMIFVTTCGYSKEAEVYARSTNVKIIDGSRLMQLVNQYLEISRRNTDVYENECHLTRIDLQQYYPPDVYV